MSEQQGNRNSRAEMWTAIGAIATVVGVIVTLILAPGSSDDAERSVSERPPPAEAPGTVTEPEPATQEETEPEPEPKPGPKRASITGTWAGTVESVGGYEVEMTITRLGEGKVSGSTDYPDLDCAGELTYQGRRGDTHTFHETIVRGRDTCVDEGRIEATLVGGELDWKYVGIEDAGEPDVSEDETVLTRRSP